MKIAVLGAGAWGTAVAAAAAARHEVLLWARDPAQAEAMRRTQVNARYLPEVRLPASLQLTDRLPQALAHGEQGLVVLATPMAALRTMLAALAPAHRAVWLCKGFESGSGLLGHEVSRAMRPGRPCAVLSGPSFALEVARLQPTALVAASEDPDLADAIVAALHSDSLRLYSSSDVVGVEVGGALKNVLAIATGLLDGLARTGGSSAPGLNARAALITRGLAEMTRLGMALGARPETFMGLSGLGDLVLTATGDLSRNRKVGLMLAEGCTLPEALARLGHVAEGVTTARTAADRAASLGIEMPITEAVVDVLEGRLDPRGGLQRLMSRQARAES